ncbi:hypothetical protein LB465_18145, partial [Salegentibacter sp. LM13S]|uniref:hypothetical protein n=1 Tax=Salegentibacter lacus TaxID=2873599 RepID=UPI001CD04065
NAVSVDLSIEYLTFNVVQQHQEVQHSTEVGIFQKCVVREVAISHPKKNQRGGNISPNEEIE